MRAADTEERVQSGLSIKVYCKQLGIYYNTYFYWQRSVRAAAATEPELCVCDPRQPHVKFSEVSVSADNTSSVEQLAQLLQALSRLC